MLKYKLKQEVCFILYSLFFQRLYSKLSPGAKYRFAIFVYYLCSKLFMGVNFLSSLLGF